MRPGREGRPARRHPGLWRGAAAGDRAGARRPAGAAVPRRAGRRHERPGDRTPDRRHPRHARAASRPSSSSSTTWHCCATCPTAWWPSTTARRSPKARRTKCSAIRRSSARTWAADASRQPPSFRRPAAERGLRPDQGHPRLTLEVQRGGTVAVVGANGAGKTTLLRGSRRCCRSRRGGAVRRRDGARRAARTLLARAGMLHVPEGRGVMPSLTVRENLRIAWEIRPTGTAFERRWRRRARPSRACASGSSSRRQRSLAASSRCSRWRAPS